MSTIILRSFAEARGVKWPREWASKVDGRPVTWAEIHAARTKRQEERLRRKRDGLFGQEHCRRAAYVWVFYQPGLFGFVYMGWWLYIRTLREDYKLDFHTLQENFALEIMQQFPCGILPLRENFDAWKEAFAKTYRRPGRFKRQGLVLGWVDLKYGRPVRFTPAGGGH